MRYDRSGTPTPPSARGGAGGKPKGQRSSLLADTKPKVVQKRANTMEIFMQASVCQLRSG